MSTNLGAHHTKILGDISLLSVDDGRVLIRSRPMIKNIRGGVFTFTFRDIGSLNKQAKLVITNLSVVMSPELANGLVDELNILSRQPSLENLHIIFYIKRRAVVLD